jgi:hypothetical protein
MTTYMRDADDHAVMQHAAVVCKQLATASKKIWSHCMTVGPALVKARNEALNRSGRNVPKGKKYNQSPPAAKPPRRRGA